MALTGFGNTATRGARFTGGVTLPPHRAPTAIVGVPVPERFQVPLPRDPDGVGRLLVEPGDRVTRGQPLTESPDRGPVPMHAPTSGTVLGLRQLAHDPARAYDTVLDLRADGEDRWHDSVAPLADFAALAPDRLGAYLTDKGVVGLGGANYATADKLGAGVRGTVHTLVLNAAECEPFLSCDEALLLHHPQDVLCGCEVLMHATGASRCLVAIEADRVDAIAALRHASAQRTRPVDLRLLRPRYPSGGERQLIEALSGAEVPSGAYPTGIGFICFNVATARAVADAVVRGRPLTSRVMTVAGSAVATAGNFEVRIGTPLNELLAAAGGYRHPPRRLVDGGPMMGHALSSLELPVSRTSTGLLALSDGDLTPARAERPCIRCGRCADVCPVKLQPQQLHSAIHAQQYEKARHLPDCIECGCCAYVCPSHIPLVQQFAAAKQQLRRNRDARLAASHARQRFEARQQRLAAQHERHDARLAGKAGAGASTDDRAALKADARAAVERARQRRKAQPPASDRREP